MILFDLIGDWRLEVGLDWIGLDWIEYWIDD